MYAEIPPRSTRSVARGMRGAGGPGYVKTREAVPLWFPRMPGAGGSTRSRDCPPCFAYCQGALSTPRGPCSAEPVTCGRRYSGRRRPDSQGLAGSGTRSSRSCIRRALALPERRPTPAVSAFGPSCPRLSARGELSGPLAERPVRAACFLPRHRTARPAPAWRPNGHSRGRRASHSGSCGRRVRTCRAGEAERAPPSAAVQMLLPRRTQT